MPTYEYNCTLCGHHLEERQNITEAPLSHCPQCGKEGLERGFGGGSATLRFVGSGFYITDYSSDKPKEAGSTCCPCGQKTGSCESKKESK